MTIELPAATTLRLSDPRLFTALPITVREWKAAIDWGWPGPDGSTASLDNIEGVVIGKTTRDPRWRHLPASRHDFFYELGRRFQLDSRYRKAADQDYRDTCIGILQEALVGLNQRLGVLRAHARYWGLRLFARRAFTR